MLTHICVGKEVRHVQGISVRWWPDCQTDKFKYTEGDELKSFDSHKMSCMFFIDELTKNNHMWYS